MKKLVIILLSALSLTAFAQKRVAILETVDLSGEVSYGIKMQVRSTLAYVVSRNTGYEGYDRANVAVLFDNPDFQRNGSISDAQLKELATNANAAYVLIAEASLYDEQNLIISAKLIDGATGSIANVARPVISGKTPDKIEEACAQLTTNLFEGLNASAQKEGAAVPDGYVDLELPSRTLWKKTNESGLYQYEDAIKKHGNKVPTKEQWLELKNSCKWVWEDNGYKIIGRNGQSIFLDNTNIMDCGGLYGYVPKSGQYWSSTPNDRIYAYYMTFEQDNITLSAVGSRCEGHPVRYVMPGGFVDLGLPSGTLWRDEDEDDGLSYNEAKEKFGSSLPTKEQWQELKDECKWTWVDPGYWLEDENGTYWHDGDMPYYLVTGKNGNSIKLSAEGYVIVDEHMCVGCGGIGGIAGYYYSSSMNEKEEFYYMEFDEKTQGVATWAEGDKENNYNLMIRLVYK